MPYTVKVLPAAQKQIRRLDPQIRRRVVQAIDKLTEDPRPLGVDKIAGSEAEWRVRVGDWRVIYEIHDDVLVVTVVAVGGRGQVYRMKR